MVRASAIGAIDFTACDDSARWWLGARFKLRAVEDELFLRVMEVHAHRAFGLQGAQDIAAPRDRKQLADKALELIQGEAMPWLGAASGQNELDDIAMWYAVFGRNLGALGG